MEKNIKHVIADVITTTVAVGIVAAIIYYMPLLFIGIIIGIMIGKNHDKIKSLAEDIKRYANDEDEVDEDDNAK